MKPCFDVETSLVVMSLNVMVASVPPPPPTSPWITPMLRRSHQQDGNVVPADSAPGLNDVPVRRDGALEVHGDVVAVGDVSRQADPVSNGYARNDVRVSAAVAGRDRRLDHHADAVVALNDAHYPFPLSMTSPMTEPRQMVSTFALLW